MRVVESFETGVLVVSRSECLRLGMVVVFYWYWA